MAYYSWKDISAFSYNSQTLTSYVREISGVKMNATMTEHQPLGAAWATPVDTAMRSHDPIVVSFFYDGGGAATPPTAAAVGTSATLTLTFATGQTVSGTFVVTDAEIVL